jgi:selenocysteine lyase/cysteine desulfurase
LNRTDPTPLEALHPFVRARFPLLERDSAGRARTYLNSGAGSLMVDTAVAALSAAAAERNPMPGRVVPGEIATGEFHARVRKLVADFLGAEDPAEISFHFSSTGALFNLAFAARTLLSGRNAVVTDLDHMANVSPWEVVSGLAGGRVRRGRVARDGTLDAGHLLSLVDAETAVVALTLASNGFGTIVPVAEVAAAVKRLAPRALVVVDAVHHALHGPIDVAGLGCDALVFSGYKVFGPMLGVLWGRREVLEALSPYRVETNKSGLPVGYEMGMLNNASLASLEAALAYLLELGERIGGGRADSSGRPARFRAALAEIEAYERTLGRRVLEGFRTFDPSRFRAYGLTDPGRAAERDPTFAFEIEGLSPTDLKRVLWDRSAIQIADGNHYSAAVVRHLGKEALARASFAHYDTLETADRFVAAVRELVHGGTI